MISQNQVQHLHSASASSSSSGTDSDTLLYVKLGFIFVIFIESVLFGVIPQRWKRCRNNEHFLSIANCFSGGVFLAIAFVHIIPESTKLYYQIKYSSSSTSLNHATLREDHALMFNISQTSSNLYIQLES